MTEVRIGSEECPLEELLEVFNREEAQQVEPGNFQLTTQWAEFARNLHVSSELKKIFMSQIQRDKGHFEAVKTIMMDWISRNANEANLGNILKIVERSFKWNIVTEFLRRKIQKHTKNFGGLDEDSRNQLLGIEFVFLGRNTSLRLLQNLVPEDTFDEVVNTIDNDFIVAVLQNNLRQFDKFQIPSVPSYYTGRTFEVKRKLNPEIFKKECEDIFIFEDSLPTNFYLSTLVRPNPADVSGGQIHSLTVRFILLEEEEHFAEIVQKAKSPVHRIKYGDNSYYWMRTFGSIRIIREFLSDDVEKIREDHFITRRLTDFDIEPFAICGGPGTGKSLLLASLANQIFQRCSKRHVIFLDFPRMIRQQIFLKNTQGLGDKKNVFGEICGLVFQMHKVVKPILKALLKNEKMQFEIFLDRIDEVKIEHFGLAKHILKLLVNSPNMRIYLTVRPNVQHDLENHLGSISREIVPFCKIEMESFLSKLVNPHLCKLVLQSADLIEKNKNPHKETAGSPLQCYMLAVVYSKSTTKKYDMSGEICWSKSPIKSLTELYSRYMEIKLQKAENKDTRLLKLVYYRRAFRKLFGSKTNAEYILQALDKHIDQFTTKIKPNDADLQHKTISEYLISDFIVKNWRESSLVDKKTLYLFVYRTLLAPCTATEGDGFLETSGDPKNDSLKSVLLDMKDTKNDLLMQMLELGWDRVLEQLQTSVLKGQLSFRHSVICYFLNDMFSCSESGTNYKQRNFIVCPKSHDYFSSISKDLVAKVLVSASCSYKHVFWLTAECFSETTGNKGSYIDPQTYQTILVLAARQDDVETFKYFCKFVVNGSTNITSIRFRYAYLKNMIYEHTPLHEAAKTGNYTLFEHLFNVYRTKVHSLTGLVQICVSDSSRNCKQVIKNKTEILRLLSLKNIKYHFKNIECSILDGVQVTLFAKVCDMVGYTFSKEDVKWLYKFVVQYFTSDDEMDVFVNWIISKDLTRLLLYIDEGHTNLVMHALRQNVLGPDSLENIYTRHNFDLGYIMHYVMNCKNKHALVQKMCDLIGYVDVNDQNDPVILQWATSMYDCDSMQYFHFARSIWRSMSQGLAKHKTQQIQMLAYDIREIIRVNQLNTTIEQIGQIQYNLNDVLGQGSFGIVYSGTLNDRNVAVKKIDYSPDQEERVAQETKLLRECDGHENIVKCFFVEKSPSTVLIALEICYRTLEQFIKMHHDAISDVQVRHLLYETTKGIEFVHNRNVIHLDITPQNILLAPIVDGNIRVKISDFGNSRKLTDKTETNLEAGTIEWMAPEILRLASAKNQSNSHALSTSADIFSLGCVFYYALSNGFHPFGDNWAEIKSNIETNNPCVRASHCKDPSWIHLFYLMINQKPDARPTAGAILKHPIFWSEKTMLTFLVAISNAADQPRVTSKISTIMDTIENYPLLKPYYEPANSRGWIRFLCSDVQAYASGVGCKRKGYAGDLFFDLVRAIRNMQTHYMVLPENVQKAVGEIPNLFMGYWLKRFAIVFQIIWLNFEVLKKDSLIGLSEYYCNEYDFNCEEVSVLADKILGMHIKKQFTQMVLQGSVL